MPETPIPSVNVLGTSIAAVNLGTAVDRIGAWIDGGATGRYICVTGVHGVMEGLRDPSIRDIHNSAAACVPDGMPMTWVGRLRGHSQMDRVYGPDLMLRLLERSAEMGWVNYFYGGNEGVADDLKRRMELRFPGIDIAGTFCPPFRPLNESELDVLVSDVESKQPDLFWVGLSTPKQERFMAEHNHILPAKIMIGVGAAFDFHTDRVSKPHGG